MNSNTMPRRRTKLQNKAIAFQFRQSRMDKPTSTPNLGSMVQIQKAIRKIEGALNTEHNFLDQIASPQSVTSASSYVVAITPPAQGDNVGTRTGDSIKIDRLDIKMIFSYSAGSSVINTSQIFNWYIFRWNKTPTTSGSTPPAIGDLFLVDPSGNFTPQSLTNPYNNQNFQYITGGQTVVNLPIGGASSGAQNIPVEVSHDLVCKQKFSSTTAASITDNLLFMVLLAQYPINTSGASTVAYSIRQWYIDN